MLTTVKPVVLLVEDDPDDAALSSDSLRAAGCRVILCNSGEAALREIDRKTPCDAIIADLRMPGMGGHELLKALKARKLQFLTVILSSSSYHRDIDRAYQSGANLYIEKPRDLDDWRKTLATLANLYFLPWIKKPTAY
jgi:CheY-like chemotaxis protein